MELKRRADKSPGSSHAKLYAGFRGLCADVIAHPERSMARENALSRDLKGIMRDKVTRFRVFYVVSAKLRVATVLFIGFRKEGDKNDAYAEFERRLRRGEFNLIFDEMGIRMPDICPGAQSRNASSSVDSVDSTGVSMIAADVASGPDG